MSNEAKVLIGISIATLAIVIGASLLIGGKPATQNAVPIANAESLVREDSYKEGAEKSKVTIVEFGDFQCPACGAAHPIVKQLLREYEGKITFVFRNFPLEMHKNANVAAQAAEAAGAQGKFYEMHDQIYNNQKDWEESGEPMEQFTKYAEEIKLDTEKFTQDVASKKFEKKVKKDIDDGYAVGVSATPTFFVNGVKQESGIQYSTFKEIIDQELAKE
ncbi:MAG: thioredoxin domain-containing protein [Candidatus Levybacteria bacterium]|nr:thioredoxin domain-containing protein [Candidatus Levybacteria bacterium]